MGVGRQLFVDLDGVLADFDGLIEREFGLVNNRENEHPNFWGIVSQYKGRLYYDMDPLPDAAYLWKKLKPYDPIILTGCPTSIPDADSDKRKWVKQYIDNNAKVITCKSRDKCKFGKPGDVLLDDWPKYKHLWEDMGGIFLVYKGNVEESLQQVKEVMT